MTENDCWVVVSLRDIVVDTETAGKIMALIKNARKHEERYEDSVRRNHIGAVGRFDIQFNVLSPEAYAEGIINGPYER